MAKYDYLGYGLGLRPKHYDDIIAKKPDIDWFEIISEDYMVEGGVQLDYLRKIRQDYPIVMHGVSMSIGSCDPLDWDYLKQLKLLAERVEPAWISDHLCWTGVNGNNLHDLMPLPYTEEALQHVVGRIQQVQEFLGRRILIENPSSYVTYKASHITEWDFIVQMAEQADCLLLVDINNIYVSGFNHNFDARHYIDCIPAERVQQFHLAGHTNKKDHIIDTHDHDIIDEVWNLYRYALERFGRVSAMIERDDHIPPFDELYKEFKCMREVGEEVLEKEAVV